MAAILASADESSDMLPPSDEKVEPSSSYDSTNKLQDVFDVNCRIIEIDTIRKTPYWVEGSAKYIFKNRDKIFRWLTPKANISPNPDIIGRLGIQYSW